MNELELIEAASQGDVDAFGELVTKYSNALFSVAYGITGDYYSSQDIVQESFIKSYLSLGSLRDTDKFGSWLYSITKRISLDWVRAKKEWLPIQEDILSATESVEECVIRQDIFSEVRRALQLLDEPNRVTMILYYMSDLKSKEIARFLNISISAVESRIKRSKIYLKSELSDLGDQFGVSLAKHKIPSRISRQIIRKIPNLVRVPSIMISVNDTSKSAEWYANVLGIHFNNNMTDVGGVQVGLTTKESAFSFLTPDLREAYLALKENRVTVSQWEEKQDHFSFEDLEGKIIVISKIL